MAGCFAIAGSACTFSGSCGELSEEAQMLEDIAVNRQYPAEVICEYGSAGLTVDYSSSEMFEKERESLLSEGWVIGSNISSRTGRAEIAQNAAFPGVELRMWGDDWAMYFVADGLGD